ncbi:dihydrodipicolinate synthase family protein [Olivibacter sp. 47]|uniref:dihydrodipicolinate synthase family protein n=1 Tax=Olivibacter sp. 47 TaxID=3056486 RepID=UPI0025A3CA20|nr:dihydrodipicolinate synthase family protein [Olivibacter sp. 47]MDM8173188.1 dihydrodipicolinate synthase family protein [Olivibacter sp. 47]
MNQQKKKFVPVMLTPFLENGAVDFEGLTQLTEFYLEAGASGLFANCQSSEMYHLQPEERIQVAKHIVRTANGRVPVVATGSFGGTTAQQVDFIKELHDQGTEAIILISGILANKKEDDNILRKRFYQLLDRTEGILFGFYECPEPYKRLLQPNLLAEFVDTGRVIYHKDTSLDIQQVREKIAGTQHCAAFGLYDAYMAHAVASLQSGAAGLSCIQGNYFPELVVWLCQHYEQKENETMVNRVQQFFIKHMDLMHTNYPLIAKFYLRKRGLGIGTFCRTAHTDLDDLVKSGLEELERERKLLFEQLDIPAVLG